MSTLEGRVEALEANLGQKIADYDEALDTIWMLLAASLVFFMHSGFSMLETGCVRHKNTQNILAKNLIVVTVGFLCWYIIGYPLAFGAPTASEPTRFAGANNFAMDGFWDAPSSFRNWLFQGAFCATGATIVSGSMAERTQLKGFITYTTLMTSFIYPIVIWWGWSGNGIFNYTDDNGVSTSMTGTPLMDFAGSGLVHLVGGIGALCGAVIVGPRAGRWEPEKQEEFEGHSIPFCVLGTFFLWFGWYGFNPGSTLEMHSVGAANTAGIVAVNTTLAPCVAGLVVFFLRAKVCPPRLLDVGGFCNGILAGLVSITAGCGFVKSWEALIIGFIGGFVYQGASMLLRKLKVDDVVDAFPVHGACGVWGLLALGFFGNPDETGGNGAFYGGDQISIQIFAVFMIVMWVTPLSIAIMLPLRLLGALRHSDEFQEAGADLMEHSPPKAYSQQTASPSKETAM
mmetsp:Transcript_104373/g.300412  ORF Transcript_104373/g.300412 Transcript_104373/m.300412 type:complete len:456 (+) Transcript_104373:81-1448(+)